MISYFFIAVVAFIIGSLFGMIIEDYFNQDDYSASGKFHVGGKTYTATEDDN